MKIASTVLMLGLLAGLQTVHAAEEDVATMVAECNKSVKQGDAAKAQAWAERILKVDAKQRDAYLCKGRALGATGQFPQALDALQMAVKLSSAANDRMIALALLGNVQKSMKSYEPALVSYRDSLKLAQQEKNRTFERVSLNLIGETLMDSAQYQAALDSYIAGDKLSGNDNERADNAVRIAAASSQLGKHDQAIEYQIRATLMLERAGTLDQIANANLELGRIYTRAGQYENAERAINKTLKLSKQNEGPYWEAMSYFYLAETKVASGDKTTARSLLNDMATIAEQMNAFDLLDQARAAIADLSKK
ncbi:tetratricopeptide repeat protein [Pseudomethylobacillus aquaticus]|nr:tetratricopeptide repeat protein [Pseudomethylobacillus aquaticus]